MSVGAVSTRLLANGRIWNIGNPLIRPSLVQILLVLAAAVFGTVPYSVERWPIYGQAWKLALHFIWRAPFWQHDRPSFWHALGAFSLMLLVLSLPRLQVLLSRPISRFLGRISFPLYVVHVPVLSVVLCWFILLGAQHVVSPLLAEVTGFTTFLAISILLAYLATPLIEDVSIRISNELSRQFDRAARQWVRSLLRRTPA